MVPIFSALTFEIDAEGIVHVNAKDLETEQEQTMEIVASSGLSDFEIDKLLRDRLIEEEQRRRFQDRLAKDVAMDSDEGPLQEVKLKLKTTIFMIQVKLNTEAKDFRRRGRALLEDTLVTARKILESSLEEKELSKVFDDLTSRSSALDDYLQSLW